MSIKHLMVTLMLIMITIILNKGTLMLIMTTLILIKHHLHGHTHKTHRCILTGHIHNLG